MSQKYATFLCTTFLTINRYLEFLGYYTILEALTTKKNDFLRPTPPVLSYYCL